MCMSFATICRSVLIGRSDQGNGSRGHCTANHLSDSHHFPGLDFTFVAKHCLVFATKSRKLSWV
jgi:hypothetical protein